MQDIIEKAKAYAINEIEQYASPKREHFDLANQQGQILAEKLWADKDIVMLWTICMDLKIGQCIKENTLSEHTQRSKEEAEKILHERNLAEEKIQKVIECVLYHHGTSQYPSLEAEICANADCYRFLHPRWIIGGLILFGRRNDSVDVCCQQIEAKIEEKFNVLSLDICKEELIPYYHTFKEIITEAKDI